MRYSQSPLELPKEVKSGDVFAALQAVLSFQEIIMTALADLQAQVDAANAAMASAVALIQSLTAELAAAKAAGNNDAALTAAAVSLEHSTAAVNAAVNPAPVAVDVPNATAGGQTIPAA